MKKRNLILSAAVAAAFGVASLGAHATSVTTATTTQIYASELFQGTTPNSVVLTLPVLNVVAGTPLTAGTYVLYVKLSGAAFTNAPALTPAVASSIATITSATTNVTSGSTYSIAVGSSTADYMATTFTVAAGQQITAGTVIGTISAASVSNAGSALGAATSTPVTVVATITNNVVVQPAASIVTFSISAANIADASSSAVNVATSAAGITSTAAAAANAGQIDLAASTGSATKFDSKAATTTSIQLGTVKFTNGSAMNAANNPYSIVNGDRINATVTAPAGFFSAQGTSAVLYLVSSGLTCSTASSAGIAASTAFTTTALAAAATSVTVTGSANPVSAATYHLCMAVVGTSAFPIAPGTATATYTLVKSAGTATDSNDVTAATTLWPVAYNAQVVDVINYVPAAVGAGWQQYLRVVNTGSVDATVSAAIIDEATGIAGTSVAIPAAGTLKKGAAMTLTSQQIEAATGAIAATARPRIRITAPTNGLQVQNMLFTPNGGFTNNSGTQ